MPRLRKYRKAAKKLAADVTAKRKAAAGQMKRGEKTAPGNPAAVIRYRVEIWREEPEVRLKSFPMEYTVGLLKRRDLVFAIAEKLFDWVDSRALPNHRSRWDSTLDRDIWETPEVPAAIPIPPRQRKIKYGDEET